MYSSKSSNTSVTAVTDTNIAVPLHTTGAAKSNIANSSNKSKKFPNVFVPLHHLNSNIFNGTVDRSDGTEC